MNSRSGFLLLVAHYCSFFLLPSSTVTTSTTTTSLQDLLQVACNVSLKGWNEAECVKTLEAYPQISSVSTLSTLATTIIELGIQNVTNTQSYMKEKLNNASGVEPQLKPVLKECVGWYSAAVGSFKSALSEIKDDKEYETANYDVQMAGDQINSCGKAMGSYKVNDSMVSSGNEFVKFFSWTADAVTTRLWVLSPPRASP